MMNLKIIVLYFFLLECGFILAQESVSTLLQAAQKFEETGNWKNAQEIYFSLINLYPDNEAYLRHSIELCIKTKYYNKALELIKAKRAQKPDDPNLDMLDSQVQFRMGNEKEALQIWEKTIENHPKKEWAIDLVAQTMSQERLLDRAIKTYLEGRKRIGKDDLFCLQLAASYEINTEYGKAAHELMQFVKTSPNQMNNIENRLLRYPLVNKTIREVVQVIEKAILFEPGKSDLKKLLVRYQIRAGLYQDALETVINLEKQVDEVGRGEALLQFAQDVFSAGGFQIALKAYEELFRGYPNFRQKDRVLYGLAQCQESMGIYASALEYLDKLIVQYSKTPMSSIALFQKGLIERNKLFLPDQAAQTFNNLIIQFPFSIESRQALLELSDCYILSNDLVKAEIFLNRVLNTYPNQDTRAQIRAQIGLAELEYFNCRFEKAKVRLDSLFLKQLGPAEIQEPLVNDGLSLKLFLDTYLKSNYNDLCLIAKGKLFFKQRRYNESIHVLDSLISAKPYDSIVSELLFAKGKALIELGKYKESADCFMVYLSRFPNYIYSDHVCERWGWTVEKMGRAQEAVKIYVLFLERYPESLFSSEIRERIQRIEKSKK